MQTPDFFRSRIDAMINLSDPLAVLATVNLRRVPAKSPGQIGLAMTVGWPRDDKRAVIAMTGGRHCDVEGAVIASAARQSTLFVIASAARQSIAPHPVKGIDRHGLRPRDDGGSAAAIPSLRAKRGNPGPWIATAFGLAMTEGAAPR